MTGAGDRRARIFPVETRFQTLARRPGGLPRNKAIERAEAEVKTMEPGFDDWLTATLQALVDAVNLAKDGGATADWVEAANFHSRQLRDVGGTMDLELVTFAANSLCDILDAIGAGAEVHMDSIQCHVDALFLARQKAYRGLKPEQVPELTGGLRRVADQISISPD
jgi:hypothetical protein